MTLTFKEVAEILKIIDGSQCDEVVLELEGTKLVIRRRGNASETAAMAELPPPQFETAANDETHAAEPERASQPEPEIPADEGLVALRAPMVGTFFRRPSPDEPAFVEVGTAVKAGDPLCLIEVMKLYTTIEAPEDGVVERIAIEDGTLVEFNALLFLIRPK